MPDVKISALPASTTPLAGTEVLPIVQSSTTRQVSVANLTDGRSVGGTNFIPSGSTVPTNGLYLPAANTIGVATNSTNVATFNSVGILGIGVTPSAWGSGFKALEVGYVGSGINATGFAQTNVVGNAYGNSGWKYAGTGVASLYQQNGSGAHAWSYAASGTIGNAITWIEAMQISTSGILLIGRTTATDSGTRLAAYNTADTSVVATFQNAHNVSGDAAGAFYLGANCNDAASTYITGALSGVGVTFKVLGNGNVLNSNNSYGSLSDIKLKENIVDATPKLANLMQVKIRNYNLINSTIKQIGVVAQELETVFPSMIDETPDKDNEGNDLGTTTKSVKYSVFVPMLIKAIQEQQALIESLTTRLTALENK